MTDRPPLRGAAGVQRPYRSEPGLRRAEDVVRRIGHWKAVDWTIDGDSNACVSGEVQRVPARLILVIDG